MPLSRPELRHLSPFVPPSDPYGSVLCESTGGVREPLSSKLLTCSGGRASSLPHDRSPLPPVSQPNTSNTLNDGVTLSRLCRLEPRSIRQGHAGTLARRGSGA